MSDLQRYLQDLEVHAGGEAVPTTRLPALHPSSRIEVGGRNEQISVDAAFEAVENCVVGFARFIGLLTGTDEVTLEVEGKSLVAVVRRDTATTEVVLRLVEDTVVESDFVLRVENTSVSPESRCRTSCAAEEKPFVLTLTSTTLDLSYAPSIVPPTAAAHLLSAVASYMLPSAPLPDLSILNHSAQKAPCNPVFTLLHSGFEHAAATYPSHPALDFLTGLPACHEVYTYAELNAVANRVAAAIHAMATDEQRIVPVYLGTSPQLYISYLAILKSGRAFCPLPIDAPIEGLSGILADMANGIVIGRGAVPASMEGRWLDIDAAIRTRESATTTPIAPREVMPEDIAYVLYTSGTDGRPKGVQISHLSATCAIDSNAQILPLSTFPAVPSRWFQFSAHTFGPSILEIFVTLSSGATLCSAERELTLANVEAVTTSLRASVMMATPSLTAAMKPAQMPTLRSLWAMGEVLGRRVIDGFAEDSLIRGIVTVDDSENGPRGLTNGYGPAEGAINCTLFPFPADYRGTIIGPPLPTCSLFVIDQESERPCPLPLGLVGELAIGGPQVAIGYLNRPEETARAFIDSEFGRLYRTGDRARVVWTREGEPVIEFLGRISEIATIGSGRVILGDVDAAVETARGVSQVATVVCSSKQGDKLVTCVVPAPGGFVEEVCDDLVTDMLPAHMRPWKYVTFPVLPTNSSGRLDRAALTNAVEVALKDCHPSFTPATSLSASGDVTPSPERAISYWKTQLDSFSPEPFPHLTGLKTSAIRQVSETVDITSKISSADLADRSRAVDSSPLAALQAAWGLILASYSDTMSEDNVFGTVRMGVFDTGSGVVPTRINLATISKESPARVESVLQHLSRANVEALQHLKFPAQALSGTHGEPPYSTVLAFETPASDILSTTATSFAVVIDVLPAANGSLKLIATFKDEFLSRSGAEIMLRQMDDVLIHILSHPESVYTDVRSDVSPELRCSLNPKPQGEPEPEDGSALQLHGQFEEHAKTHPRDIAFIFKYDLDDDSRAVQWTYAELNERADRLATYLVQTYGPLTDCCIPLCLHKSPELYISVLAVLKAGGGWCPIDPAFPAQRKRDLILRTKAKLLLITDPANVAGDAVPAGVPLVNVADALSRIPSPDYALLAEIKAAAKSNHLAYLIWTSGTTGAPKGVPIEHHSGVASMKALQAGVSHDVEGGVRLLQFASYTFDVFIQDLFYAWGVGGVLIAATQEITFGNIAGLANKTNATHAHLTPAYSAGVPRSSCPTFQVITMIGEKLTQNVADDWAVNMRAYNTYGPAEATVVSTMRQFGGVEDPVKAENVGIPLPTVSCHVLRNGRVTMLGGVGELALGGSHLARGYLDDSEKTNAKFIWDEELQERIYLTGDIVRFLHDGSIEFVGRTDDQVKLGGIRVELSEISAAMFKCHPLADRVETMFINRRDRPNKIIVTFVAASQLAMSDLKPNTAITGDGAVEVALAARAQAQEILPEYMVPGLIMVIPFVPQTPSAKIDRKALSATYESIDLTEWDLKLNPVPKQPVQESRSVVESVVIKQIAVLSGMEIDSINLNASLRSLGIDSIRAIQLAAWMKKRGYTLSVLNIIESRTIKELVACIKVENDGSEKEISSGKLEKFDELWHHSVALKMGDGAEFAVLPCSPLQEGLLGETMKNPSAYWSNNFFTLSRKIDLDRLHRAWCQVAEQTEALRAAFIPTAELSHQDPVSRTFVQIVYKQHPGVEWKKVSNSVDNLRDEAKRHAAEITQRNHERAYNAPLWAVTIFERDEHSVMMWSLHHALHDAASLGFIIGDVQAAYLGYNIVPRSQLTDALRLTITEEEADEKKNEEFWTEELKDFVDPEAIGFPDLTGKKPDPSKGRKVYLETECRISATDIQAFAPHFDPTSLISIVRAAWGCTLAGYLETSNIVIGETLSERIQDATLSNTIAPLISVVPVPIQAHATAREILENQSRLSRDVWKHRHILPTTMRKVLQRPQSGALYPAMFVFHPNSEGASEVISAIWTPMEDIVGLSVEHGLALDVFIEADGQYRLVFSAEESLMGNAQLELLMRQVEAYVKLMAMHADMPVPELVPSFPEELLSIARPVVSEAVRSAYETDPMSWVEYYAEKHPEWLAAEVADSITSEGAQTRAWSYAQLNAQANRIAGFIDSCDIGRNRMVALCLPRTLEAYAPIAGVFKAGCGYLSIDEGLPAERKGLLLEDSNAGILFTTTELIKTFPELPAGVVTINIDDPEFVTMLATYSAVNRSRDTRRDDISYLLYTSGSTGKPKGVQVSRGNLSAFVEAQSDFICREVPATLELGGKGKYLGLASRAFDVHVAEMFLAWRHGLATVTALRSMLLDDIGLALAQLKVTHASFVPSLLDQADLVPADVPTLRFMGVGGEKISQRVLDTWAASKTVSLVNAYGPTEVTICCSSLRVSPDSTVRNIGHLIGNLVGYVFVPGTFIPTKRGQPGELCVSGDLVALGYYQRPEAKGFVDYNGARLYRTGDMVRLLSGDAIEYLGRSDDQAKIRGQRLELGEVSEGIRASAKEELDVATLILQHPELSRPQLACFVARSADRATFSGHAPQFLVKDYQVFALELQAGCRQKLPAYMVPDVVIPINIMPLAPMSGKADAKLLKALFSGIPLSDLLRGSGVRQSAASRELTQAEMEIRDMIAKIIKIEPDHVFHASNIFELGIDSLSAITLSLKMKNIGYNSSVASVLGHPTIEELAALPRNTVARENSAENELLFAREQLRVFDEQLRPRISSIVGVSAAPIAAVRPTLPLQEGIIARSINSESGPIYVNHVILKLGSEVDLEKLRQAWKETIDSNEILRTCFCQPDDAFVQVVLSAGTLEEEWQESSAETVDDALAAFRRRQNDVATEIISQLHQRPPLRLNLSRTRSDSSLLFISMHHSIYDGESFMMLLDEVSRHYQSTAVPERVAFSSFLEHLASQSIEKAKDFWTNSLTDCRSTLLSTETGYRKEEEVFFSEHVMSRPLSALEACASSMRCTLPSLAQLVFGILLAQRVGHNDVIFGSVLSGRTATVDLAEMILAPLVTTIPQRVKLQSGTSTIAELAEDYQKSNALCLEYQHISLRQIQRWAGADKPLFDTLFSFTRKVATPGAGLWEEIESATVADYPFAIEFEADTEENKLVARVGFTPSYGTAAEVKVVLEKFDFLLQEIEHGHATLKLSSLGVSDLNTDIEDRKTDVYDEVSWSSTETTMRELAAEICQLPLAQITKGATFYSLGIDSVTAIRFARRLREMDIAVSSSDVIRFPSIGALSRHVAQVEDEASPSVEAPAINITEALKRSNIEVDYESIEAVYTCTPLQSGMITQTLASDGRLYVHHHCVKLDSSVDLLRLQSSWFNVVEKTDVLRTSFYHSPTSENPWTALVRKTSPAKVIEDDASVSFDQTLADIVNNVVFTEEHDFHNPPAQARIVRTPTDNYFVLSLHHSLYDGVSIPFVFHDLASAYLEGSFPRRRPFSDAAALIAQRKDDAAEYWLRTISDYSVIHLARLTEGESSSAIHQASKTLGPTTAEILAGCKSLGVTLQSVLLLAWGKTLSSLVGRRDIVFGQVVSGRTLPLDGVEGISGPLFNTVPMRIRLLNNLQTNESAVSQIQLAAAESQVHQHASLRTIQNRWRAVSGGTAGVLFDTLLVFQKVEEDDRETSSLWTPVEVETGEVQAEYPLNIEIVQGTQNVVLQAAAQGEFMTNEKLKDVLEELSLTVLDILQNPARFATAFPASLHTLPVVISDSIAVKGDALDARTEFNPDEAAIRKIISEIASFPSENITLRVSIYAYGIDSISAIRVAAACRKQGIKLSVADILQGGSIEGICARSARLQKPPTSEEATVLVSPVEKDRALAILSLSDDAVETVLPVLAGQFFHLEGWLKCGRTSYQPTWTFAAKERLNIDRLQVAWQALLHRHQILRTAFAAVSPEKVLQVILKPSTLAESHGWSFEEVEGEATPAVKKAVYDLAHSPLDMFTPPVRLTVLRGDDFDAVLFNFHHAVYDAWSMPSLISDLISLYSGTGCTSNAAFATFAEFVATTRSKSEEESYWKASLAAAESTVIGPTYNASPCASAEQTLLIVPGVVENYTSLEARCKTAGMALSSLVLTSFSRVLAAMTETRNPTFGIYQVGRSASFDGLETLAGPCLNLLPLTVPADLSARDAAKTIQAELGSRSAFEQTSVRDVLRYHSGPPLEFNVFVNLLWHTEKMREDPAALLKHITVGAPADFCSEGPLNGITALDALDVTGFPRHPVFVDLGPNLETDTIDFGVRCDRVLMNEEEVQAFVARVGEELMAAVEKL